MLCRCAFILALLFALAATVYGQTTNPLVRTAHGILAGEWRVSTGGRPYASFRGVPYARPPVGKYRFREPQRLKPWIGTWDATRPGPVCLQYNPFSYDPSKIDGSENCLFVNVHTPNVNSAANLPVVVFIHGGAFMYGTGSLYGAEHFMDKDIVLVTLNYRLGPLGFLSTGDETVPGNMGLKDQAFALRWVQDNILMFGGNPDSVTLTGLSAGGASVHYHYLSPLSRGTFARGIAFSGASFAPWTQATKPAEKARGLAAHIGCPTANTRDMVDCLRHRPAESIVNAQTIYFDWKVHMFTSFIPVVEPMTSRDPFITRPPYQVARSGQAAPVPLIISVTSEEGLYPAAAYQLDSKLIPELEAHWTQLASEIFVYNETLPVAQRAAVAEKIKKHYLQGKPVSQETFPQLVQALGDRLFCVDVGKAAQIHAAKSGQPVYVYRYSFRGEKSLSHLMAGNTNNYGVSHADDVFHLLDFPDLDMNRDDDKEMRQLLLEMVYSYATTGTPKVPGLDWPQVEPGSAEIKYVEISAPGQVTAKSTADFGHKSFWDSLGFVENENAHIARDEL